MDITYIGHSCFKIKGKDVSLVIDPYDPTKTGYKLSKLEADIVLLSHDHFDHNYIQGVSNYGTIVDTPGEYEIKDVSIYGIETFHDNKKGVDRGKNIMYLINIDGIDILHAGDLGHELDDETLEKLWNVDVLLIPVGGTYTIDAEAASKVISSIEPGIVIPMHYQTADTTEVSKALQKIEVFLNEMGVENNVKSLDKLKISSKSDIPDETEVVVLEPQH